ncbi:alkaline phosphatase D family protein [Pelagicoccus sp. SDUM812003]|uniref:alkaline phosphatase D family protein n=1 Tax=Pelagicoccus sp. SDUM812003 TaxID=3041267 RepID=UPI00280E6DFA|nr:alkaline phosphatase D family protein [Pelagicoccus sp. SDUM812003]MDQ8201434.1 alkaline phosphatase D family protein [Pelagicoccus sp. SDUM812003]
MKPVSRRNVLKLLGGSVLFASNGCVSERSNGSSITRSSVIDPNDAWSKSHDRVWIGGDFWANPMEDWRIANGGAECISFGGNRSVHSLTRSLAKPNGDFLMSVTVSRLGEWGNDGGGGFRIGVRSEIDEYRSNCFVQSGLDAGIKGRQLVLGNESLTVSEGSMAADVRLTLSGTIADGKANLNLEVRSTSSDSVLGVIRTTVSDALVFGNVAIVSNFSIPSIPYDQEQTQLSSARYRFENWTMEGDAFSVAAEHAFGPILWSMYTLSDSRSEDGFVLKLSAFTGPLGAHDNKRVELQCDHGSGWESLGFANLDSDAWVATFRIPNWSEKKAVPYRLVYREKHRDQSETPAYWEGVVRANPTGPLRMAGLTCQNDYAFPYEPVVKNVKKLDPDLVFFSGDQIYENHGGFGYIREPAEGSILNYLRKFYQFGWAFREVMKDAPTVCLPDDHDVLQGNLWGEGGAKMENPDKDPGASILGGYVEPVRVVNAVHRTNVAHHPDPYDPTPAERGISVYFGDMVYGGVGFAILADRQWKSGPERIGVIVGHTGRDEDPLFVNPDFNPEGLELLGERQERFLKVWADDWRGHKLKAVLSQTVFAGLSTHQPRPDRYLKYDFDGSGWPPRARNRAIGIMRTSMALHICGDTHLGTFSQYGVEAQRDSNWAFCTPAIAAGWSRWWNPDDVPLPFENRPSHDLPNTGEYQDSFGNKVYVYAVGNPQVGTSSDRYKKAHQKGSGFGFITFDTVAKTYTVEAYRFLVDATDGNPANQFPGWPATIQQLENRGENRLS